MRITRDDYHRGKDYFTDQSQDLFERYYMKMPSERRLPEALEELFEQLQANLGINLIELLVLCVQKTERIAVVRSLVSENYDNAYQEKISSRFLIRSPMDKCEDY